MLNKRGRIAISEILILVIAIFAFGYLISGEFRIVSSETWTNPDDVVWTKQLDGNWLSSQGNPATDSQIKGFKEAAAKLTELGLAKGANVGSATSGVSSLPTKPSHGYAGWGIEKIFGEGSTAPAGKYLNAIGTEVSSSGLGYSAAGIVQGAGHAIAIYYGVKMVAGLFGMDDATN